MLTFSGKLVRKILVLLICWLFRDPIVDFAMDIQNQLTPLEDVFVLIFFKAILFNLLATTAIFIVFSLFLEYRADNQHIGFNLLYMLLIVILVPSATFFFIQDYFFVALSGILSLLFALLDRLFFWSAIGLKKLGPYFKP